MALLAAAIGVFAMLFYTYVLKQFWKETARSRHRAKMPPIQIVGFRNAAESGNSQESITEERLRWEPISFVDALDRSAPERPGCAKVVATYRKNSFGVFPSGTVRLAKRAGKGSS